jgi:hypothetical protein
MSVTSIFCMSQSVAGGLKPTNQTILPAKKRAEYHEGVNRMNLVFLCHIRDSQDSTLLLNTLSDIGRGHFLRERVGTEYPYLLHAWERRSHTSREK